MREDRGATAEIIEPLVSRGRAGPAERSAPRTGSTRNSGSQAVAAPPAARLVDDVYRGRRYRVFEHPAVERGGFAPGTLGGPREVVIAFDSRAHAWLVAGDVECHGRVVYLPVAIQARKANGLRADYAFRLRGLGEGAALAIEEQIRRLAGARTMSCSNALLWVLYRAAGLRPWTPRGWMLLPHAVVRGLLEEGLAAPDGSRVVCEIHRSVSYPLETFFRRMRLLQSMFVALAPVFGPGLAWVALARRRLVRLRAAELEGTAGGTPGAEAEARLPSDRRALAPVALRRRLAYLPKLAWNWFYSTLHNAYGSYQVVRNMMVLEHGLLEPDHPFVTGVSPHTGREPWLDNVVFRSPRAERFAGGDPGSDDEIVMRIGRFMTGMVKKSTGPMEVPHGPRRRLAHAVNYLHGPVHFTSSFLLFNDFRDAVFFFSDPRFEAEIRRFSKRERRELTLIFREREYDLEEYSHLIGFLRSVFPWYANPNGPKKRVLYGTPSPFPVVNLVNGSWTGDMKRFRRGEIEPLLRPSIAPGLYFQGAYRGTRRDYALADRLLAFFNYLVIWTRGFQGSLVFHLRKRIEPRQHREYLEARRRGERPPMVAPVGNPFRPRDRGAESPR